MIVAAFLGFKCPEAAGFFGDEYRFYRHSTDCQRYFICINGKPRVYNCGEGYAFNDDIGGCDGIENVTGWLVQRVYRVEQEEWTKLREGVPYVKLYRKNPKHLYPKLNGLGDNGQ